MNKVILIGRLTKDIELKQTQGGKAYCNFTIAINNGKEDRKSTRLNSSH